MAKWHRHNQRQLAAGRQRVVVTLPGHAIATLDAVRGEASRSAAVLRAIEALVLREQAPAPPAPPTPALETVLGKPRRAPPVSPLAIAAAVARRDRANRVPVFVMLPGPVPLDLRNVLDTAGLRHRGAGWVGRLRGGSVQRLAELVAAHGGALHVTGERGDDLLKAPPGTVPALPPPVRSAWIDALREYGRRFGTMPPGQLFSPPHRPRPGHFSPPYGRGLPALVKQRLIPVLREAAERGDVLTEDKVRQVIDSVRWS